MYSCRNLGKEGCNPYIVNYRKRSKSKKNADPGEIKSIWPGGEESKELDEICKRCESRFFGIKEKECPVCGSKNFKETKGFEFYEGEIKTREDSFLVCKRCGTFSRFIKLL